MQKVTFHNILGYLQFLSISLVAISLPWPIRYNSWAIAFFALILLVSFRKKEKYNKVELLFVGCCFLYFLLHLSYFFYEPKLPGAWAEVERKATLLFFPLILLSGNFDPFREQKNFSRVLNFYILSIVVACFVCLSVAFSNYLGDGNTKLFYYHAFCKPIGHHAIYFSAQVIIAIIFCYKLIMLQRRKILYFLLIGFLFFILFLLSSKTMVFYSILIFLILYISHQPKEKRLKKLFVTAAVAVSLVVTIITLNSNLSKRFDDISMDRLRLLKQEHYHHSQYFDGLILRLVQLKFASQILAENNAWLMGVGPAESQNLLNEKYSNTGMFIGLDGKGGYLGLNFHNQYAETFVRLGIIGFIVFILMIVYSFRISLLQRNILLFLVVLLFSAFCLSESVFETQRGIVTFTFFSCFLIQFNRKV